MSSVAPSGRLPRDGERVTIMNHVGTVRHVGVTQFATGIWVGVEFDEAVGKNNGTVKDVAYFACEPFHGMFVRPKEVVFSDESSAGGPGATSGGAATAPERPPPEVAASAASPVKAAPPAVQPAASAAVRVGDRVSVTSSNHIGIVRHVGPTQFATGIWIGVEFEEAVGKNNGTVKDVTYFTCEPNHGMFVRQRDVKLIEESSTGTGAVDVPASAKASAPQPASARPKPSPSKSPPATPAAADHSTGASPEAASSASPAQGAAAAKVSAKADGTPKAKAKPTVGEAVAKAALLSPPKAKAAGDSMTSTSSRGGATPKSSTAKAGSSKAAAPAVKSPTAQAASPAVKSPTAQASSPAVKSPTAASAKEGSDAGPAAAKTVTIKRPVASTKAKTAAVSKDASAGRAAVIKEGKAKAKATSTALPKDLGTIAPSAAASSPTAQDEQKESTDAETQPQPRRRQQQHQQQQQQQQQPDPTTTPLDGSSSLETSEKLSAEKPPPEKLPPEKSLAEQQPSEKPLAEKPPTEKPLAEKPQDTPEKQEEEEAKPVAEPVLQEPPEEEVRRVEELRQRIAEVRDTHAQGSDDIEAMQKQVADAKVKREEASTRISALRKELSEASQEEEKWAKELTLASQKEQTLQKQSEKLEKDIAHANHSYSVKRIEAAQILAAKVQKQDPEQLRVALEVEKARLELAELRAEEAEVKLEEARDLEDMGEEAEDKEPKLTEEEQLEMYQQALAKLYEEHTTSVRVLKKRVVALEKVDTELKQGVHVDGLGLQMAFDQLSHQYDGLMATAQAAAQVVEERRKLCLDADEMVRVHEDLEAALAEELRFQEERERQLEALARSLAFRRERLRQKRQEERAAVAKVEVRLQTAQAQRAADAAAAATARTQEKLDPSSAESEAVSSEADAAAARMRAELFTLCLPEAVREEAGLGHGLETMFALHRIFRKAEILSSSILELFVEDPMMWSQASESGPMLWLCSASVAGSQCAYAAAGVAGRLQASEAQRYFTVLSSPSMRACTSGETTLDTALATLRTSCGREGQLCMEGARKEVLSGLNAASAQLVSMLRSVFKDDLFVSWQGVECAVRAVQGACATALLASCDAGGSRRKKWQGLFDRSRRLGRRLSGRARPRYGSDDFFSCIEPAIEGTSREDEGQTEDLDEAPSPSSASPGGNPRKSRSVAGEPAGLSQALLDGMLVQVATLQAHAPKEPAAGADAAGDRLDRALAQVDFGLAVLEKAVDEADMDSAEKRTTAPALPWVETRDSMRRRIEEAEVKAVQEEQEVHAELETTKLAIAELNKKLEEEQIATSEVEREYSHMRIAAERSNLVQEDLGRLQQQAEFQAQKLAELAQQLQQEQDQHESAENDILDLQRQGEEVQQQIAHLEEQLQKKYSADATPEEVAALQARCADQQRKLQRCHGQRRDIPSFSAKLARQCHVRQPFEVTEDNTASLADCWQEAREVRRKLLLEQANTVMVDLTDEKPHHHFEAKHSDLAALVDKSAVLRADITSLLREVSGIGDVENAHAAVALTRHLKAGGMAARAATLTLPALEPWPAALKADPLPALTLADHAELKQVHQAMI